MASRRWRWRRNCSRCRADTAALLLFGRGHANDGEGFAVARQVTIQPADQFGSVGFVGVDAFTQQIQFHRPDHQALDTPADQLAGQDEAARAGFIDRVDLFGQGQLFFDESLQVATVGIDALGRLSAGAIELTHDAQIGRMLINAQQDPLIRRFGDLRIGGDCVEVRTMSVGLHIREGVDCVFHRLKLPPVAALANTHAILSR